jgi:hypothetical protein
MGAKQYLTGTYNDVNGGLCLGGASRRPSIASLIFECVDAFFFIFFMVTRRGWQGGVLTQKVANYGKGDDSHLRKSVHRIYDEAIDIVH